MQKKKRKGLRFIKAFLNYCNELKIRGMWLIMAFLPLLTGCGVSDEDIYYYVSDQTKMLAEGGGTLPDNIDWKERLYLSGVELYDTMVALAPFIILISILLGMLVKGLIKKEPKLRRNGMVLFFGVIPFLAILLSYGLGALLTWFHH